jgi:hypothetical protein
MESLSIADDVTFVLGTGRCGSTLLSRILSRHPEVLSLSEFLEVVFPSTSSNKLIPDMDGGEVWKILSSTDAFVLSALRAGVQIPEIAYPCDRGRFSLATGIPKICLTVLPTLTDDPDALYDRLAAEVPRWPKRSPDGHCRALFDFLARATGRRIVVERTAGSLPYAQLLHDAFPSARFVHMHRDGPDCALSMSRHSMFRYIELTRAAATAAGLPWPWPLEDIMASLPEQFAGILTPPIDLERYMTYPLPLTWFGEYWSDSTVAGIAALRDFPRDSWTSVKYEDLLSEPEAELTRLAKFLGIAPSPEWLAFAQRQIHRGSVGTAAAHLDPDALRDLQQACAPGIEAIRTNEGYVKLSVKEIESDRRAE